MTVHIFTNLLVHYLLFDIDDRASGWTSACKNWFGTLQGLLGDLHEDFD